MQPEVYKGAINSDGEPEVHEPEAPEEEGADLLKLDYALISWLILFVFGGGLLALYYAGIGYFPDFTWQDSLTYLALLTITGASLLMAFGFLLLAPGAIWSEFLVFDPRLLDVLTYKRPASPRERSRQGDQEPCVLSISLLIIVPFLFFLVFCHALLLLVEKLPPNDGWGQLVLPLGVVSSLAALLVLLWRNLEADLTGKGSIHENAQESSGKGKKRSAQSAAPAVRRLLVVGSAHVAVILGFLIKLDGSARDVLLFFLAVAPLLSFSDRDLRTATGPCRELGSSRPGSLLCRYLLAFLCGALFSLMSVLFFHKLQGSSASISVAVVCTLVVVLANLVVAILFHIHPKQALLASFLAALILLGAGYFLEGAVKVPSQIMAKFGFGKQSATLVVTELGSRLLSPHVKVDSLGKESPFATVGGVEILSRLGPSFVLRCGKRIVSLPRKEVLSWSAVAKPSSEGSQTLLCAKVPEHEAALRGTASSAQPHP